MKEPCGALATEIAGNVGNQERPYWNAVSHSVTLGIRHATSVNLKYLSSASHRYDVIIVLLV